MIEFFPKFQKNAPALLDRLNKKNSMQDHDVHVEKNYTIFLGVRLFSNTCKEIFLQGDSLWLNHHKEMVLNTLQTTLKHLNNDRVMMDSKFNIMTFQI